MCVHWMVHRPSERFFSKTAVIITNSTGAHNGTAQRDVKTSHNWMGLSRVYTGGMDMMGDIQVDKMCKLSAKACAKDTSTHMNLKVWLLFAIAKPEHKMALKSETVSSLDNQYYIDHGWIKR